MNNLTCTIACPPLHYTANDPTKFPVPRQTTGGSVNFLQNAKKTLVTLANRYRAILVIIAVRIRSVKSVGEMLTTRGPQKMYSRYRTSVTEPSSIARHVPRTRVDTIIFYLATR
jgi:hypothetical protein